MVTAPAAWRAEVGWKLPARFISAPATKSSCRFMVMSSSLGLQPKQINMEHHIPIHPLPEDIQQMPQNETVCKYCGVSYLIHHEFKLMEEKLKAMEAELEYYRDSVVREKKLQGELYSINQCVEQLKNDNGEKNERLNVMSGQLATKQKELEDSLLKTEVISGQLIEAQSQRKLFRERTKRQGHVVEQAASSLHGIKIELAKLKEDVRGNLAIWDPFSKTLAHCLKVTNSSVQLEMFGLQESVKKSNEEVDALQHQVKELHLSTSTVVSQTQQINDLAQKKSLLQIRCHELQEHALDLENQVNTQQLHFQKVTEEKEHGKELLLNKSKEVADLLSRLTKLECADEEQQSRHCKEIKEKEETWLRCVQKCKGLEEQLEVKVRKESEVENQSSKSLSEIMTLKDALGQVEEKLVALKQEREQMIISHQNRIEQLQESFRQKLSSEESWRAKMDSELSKQHAKHSTDLKELTRQMKEEAKVEIDIERERHQELITKYREEYKALQTKVPDLVNAATKEFQMEISSVKIKLQEAQCQLSQEEHCRDDEISKLGKIISRLETQLKQEQNRVESMNEELRTEVQQKSIETRESQQVILQLREELCQTEEENTFLAETVRRECVERYELTEALTQAREQLKEFKKLSRELPRSQPPASQGSLSSSSSHASSQARKSQSSPSNSSWSKANGLQGLPARTSPLNSAGCTSLPAIPVLHPAKGRTASVSEIKQRIAAAVKRK
ncbi:protein LEKR1 isoform X2 [Leucoraja erinacea]|uniref:protein LEKR1 isoform X2 n=1 Tax=Leucoraja erinaceus TaxID=7782 RepID=UPI002454A4AD|nr:protein LEKR1 isoform X2 [Leucoraja erinacea]